MPIYVSWGDETESYIHYQLFDPWDWDDYYAASYEWKILVNSVNHPVITLLDFSKSGQLPTSAMTHLKKAAMSHHPNFGGLIIVGVNTFVRIMVQTMMRILPNGATQVRMAATLDDALLDIQNWSDSHLAKTLPRR